MCEVCGQSPCHPRCPNAPEPEPLGRCEVCDEPIFDWEDRWKINGVYYCDKCIYKFFIEGK